MGGAVFFQKCCQTKAKVLRTHPVNISSYYFIWLLLLLTFIKLKMRKCYGFSLPMNTFSYLLRLMTLKWNSDKSKRFLENILSYMVNLSKITYFLPSQPKIEFLKFAPRTLEFHIETLSVFNKTIYCSFAIWGLKAQ